MLKRVLLGILLTYFSVGLAFAQSASISSGLSWLAANQNSDKSWGNSSSLTEQFISTAETLETFRVTGNTGMPFQEGLGWLNSQQLDSTDFAAKRLQIRAKSAFDVTVDINGLIALRNVIDGNWGLDDEYSNAILDTALALQPLKSANYTDLTAINPALAYLTGSQNLDGGWGFPSTGSGQADSNVYLTAIVSATLQQFPQMTTIATAVNKATIYLLAQQNADGGFGSPSSTAYETALAYTALVAVSTNQAALTSAANYLITSQSANGSWNDDPYSTALALKALYLSENKPSPPPPAPAGGKITGTVIDKITGQKVTGVAVVLDSNQLINTTTDAFGNFTLSDIPAGAQKVNFSLTGYAATSATATVVVDVTASLGIIPMTSAATTGTIAGTITDSTGKPLTGVAITITGAWSGSATTGADGTYSFTYVTPGTVTISAAKTGFQTVTATGSVYARTTLTFSPRMSATASQVTTGILVGRVVDSYWGVPMGHLPEEKGVRVIVPGLAEVPVEPEGLSRG
ncbi:MAG: carboxypeptidase regulatory-like domain-containing protein [Desulfuromonadaceae bacterium]|nr:carboxypeptidase regulatory-like domain-containing protein [Desulfuromonadaceae bacterium]MDD5107650.1 carboxypeptidase regulatory-like domain-containing protein [Desulfuromonadaceae bacterium]